MRKLNRTVKYPIVLAMAFLLSMAFGIMASPVIAKELDRLVEIDLDPVQNAKRYEVRATPIGRKDIKPLVYQLKNTAFSERLPLGNWRFEVRSFDRRDVGGLWTALGDVNIGFKPPTPKSPTAGARVKTSPDRPAKILFQWETFSESAEHKLTIKDTNGDSAVVDQVVTGSQFTYDLKPGNYSWSLTSKVPEGSTLDGKDPEPVAFMVNGGKLGDPAIIKFEKSPPEAISWNAVPRAAVYNINLEKLNGTADGASSTESIVKKSVRETSEKMPADLTPGTYKFSVTASAPGFDDSRQRFIQFRVKPKPEEKSEPPIKPDQPPAPVAAKQVYLPPSFAQASIGPVFWTYNFKTTAGSNFGLMAFTMTALAADINKWFQTSESSAWALEIRGRQTNIYLFEEAPADVPGQTKVTVADRRLALIGRKRKVIKRAGVDAILGIGTHHYTYLVQSDSTSIVQPIEGDLLEFYIGGAIDWQMTSGNHVSFDLTFHPVGTSIGIAADQTWQYTASAKYLRNIFHERSYLSFSLENFRSRVNTHSSAFEGEAETTSSWYRISGGLAIKI